MEVKQQQQQQHGSQTNTELSGKDMFK